MRPSSSTLFWPNHWNGVCGFGHEPADRHRAARLLRVLATDVDDVLGELGDAERVVVHLGGQAGEEVELHPPPTLRVRGVDRAVEILLEDQLVDHLAQAPRAGLGRERQPGAAHLLDLRRDLHAERVDAQARQRDAHLAGADLVVHQIGDDAVDAGEVRARQRGERDLVVTGAGEALAHHRAHLLLRALPHRAGDHPGLAEAATAGAAAEDLDVQAVVHDLDERHELTLRVRPLGEIGDGALVDDRGNVGEARPHLGDVRAVVVDVVHRRHVHARDRRELAQHRLATRAAALPRADDVGDLADDLFAVADDERVDVLRERLRVVAQCPPAITIGSAGERSSLRTATPARSTRFSRFV